MSTKKAVATDRKLYELREDAVDALKKYRIAMRENRQLRSELDALHEVRRNIKTHVIKPQKSDGESEATIVAVASDWHVEEEVMFSQTNGLNRYNLDIAKSRSQTFFSRIVRLARKEQQDVTIKELVLFLGGDFITGRLHEENLEACLLRPIDATIFAQELLNSGIKFLVENTKLNITVVCKVGNHSRITKRVHHGTEAGNALETMMYHNLHAKRGSERVKFVIETGYHTYMKIYDFTARFHHGHNVQYGGGVGGLTIPLNKAVHSWNLTKRADFDFLGHFHDYMTYRRFVVNGSLIGYNAFAVAIKAEYQPPIQAFMLIDKRRGKTVHIPILFDD